MVLQIIQSMKDINIISLNTTLTEIQNNISVRSHTVCLNAGFNNAQDILRYFLRHKTFKKLRNCGDTTELELRKFCKNILENHDKMIVSLEQPLEDEPEPIEEVPSYSALTEAHLDIISMYIENNLKKLEKQNIRAKNVIENFWKDKDFIQAYIFLKKTDFNYLLLKNAGVSTIPTIESFFDLVFSKADELLGKQNNNDSDDLTDIITINSFDQAFLNLDSLFSEKNNTKGVGCFENYKADYLNREFPILKFIEDLLNNYVIFNERKTEIFKHQYHYFTDLKPLSLEELSEQHQITRERVRQLSVTLVDDFWEEIEKIAKCIDLNYAKQYTRITQDKPFISLNEYDLDSLRTNYFDGFNLAFTHKLVSIFDPNYILLNDDGIRSSGRKSKIFSGNHNFLIKKEIVANFRLDDFFEDFHSLINDEIDEEFILPIEGYISNYFSDKKELLHLPVLRQFIESVALKEFDITTDFEDNLIISRNTRMSVADYVYEALKGLNKPSHISEIFEWINNELPHLNIRQKSLGTSTLRDERIIFFGRSSTYGLKDWESLGTYKGGTIRSIVEEYLEQFEEPQHIFDILEYTLKYRPETNFKSLDSNIKLISDSEIKSCGNGYWRLKNKSIPENFTIVPIPKSITRMLKSNYFHNSNIISYQTLIKNLMSKYSITFVQARYFIQTKIEQGTLGIDKENGIITLIEC